MTSTPPSPPYRTGTSSSSSNQTSHPSASAQAPSPKPPAPPVSILPSQTARIYSFAHPLLLLVLLAARFRGLVADPVGELLGDLPALAALQVVYAVLCLPPAGAPRGNANVNPAAGEAIDGAGTVLRPGRVGLRRKHHHGKGDSVSVKVVVRFPTPDYATMVLTTRSPL